MLMEDMLFMTDKNDDLIILLCFEHLLPSVNRFRNNLVWVAYLLNFVLYSCCLVKVLVAENADVRTGLYIFY